MHRATLLFAFCFTATAATAAQPWHTTMSLANNGYWRQRIRLVLHNETARPLAGQPVEVKIGAGDGEAALAGARADELRVVTAADSELLWAVTGPAGQPIRSGPIPPGSVLTVPAECPAQAEADYFLYFDNPDAWPVPDFLDAASGLRNGGLEEGQGDAPSGWTHDAGDAQHHAAWVTEQPHSGHKCLRTVVAAGAEPTWISTRQSPIHVAGGGAVCGCAAGSRRPECRVLPAGTCTSATRPTRCLSHRCFRREAARTIGGRCRRNLPRRRRPTWRASAPCCEAAARHGSTTWSWSGWTRRGRA